MKASRENPAERSRHRKTDFYEYFKHRNRHSLSRRAEETWPRKTAGGLRSVRVPLLLATFWLHYVRTTGGSLGISSRGELIHPAFPLEQLELGEIKRASAAESENEGAPFNHDSLRGIWTMFYAPQGHCDEACEKNIYHMRQVRLALNHRMDRVQRVLLVSEPGQVSEELVKEHPGLRVLQGTNEQYQAMLGKISEALAAAEGDFEDKDAIYLIDPFANLMMRFPADLPPKSMLKDIKHLLKVSRIG